MRFIHVVIIVCSFLLLIIIPLYDYTIYFILFYLLYRAAPVVYGGSQATGQIGAAAISLCHSHNNAGSQLHLRLTPHVRAMQDP